MLVPSFRTEYGHLKNLTDSALNCDLAFDLGSRKDLDLVVLVTGDKDFIPAVMKAREAGKQVCLFHNLNPSKYLLDVVSQDPQSMVFNISELAKSLELSLKKESSKNGISSLVLEKSEDVLS